VLAFGESGCNGGCALKFAAMTLAGAAATALGAAGAWGFIATLASDGVLAPAEAVLVAGFLTAEGVFLDRLDNWLDCINSTI